MDRPEIPNVLSKLARDIQSLAKPASPYALENFRARGLESR